MAKPAAPDHIEKFVWDSFPAIVKKPKKAIALGGDGSGNFGHVGRPGAVGGSASSHDQLIETKHGKFRDADHEAAYLAQRANNAKAAADARLVEDTAPGGRFETEAQRIDAQQHTEQRLQFLLSGGSASITAPTPQLIRAGERVATVLEEMKEQGLKMPDNILIGRTHDRSPHAAIRGVTITDIGKGEDRTKTHALHLEVSIPETLPEHVSLDDAAAAVFNKKSDVSLYAYNDMDKRFRDGYDKFTAKNFTDVITHEMGHVQAGHRGNMPVGKLLQQGTFGERDDIRRASIRVSEYADNGSADEFLAEAFTRLYRGETLAEDSQKLYDALDGPKVPTR